MNSYTLQWLPPAVNSYRRVLDYLQIRWGSKVVSNFITITDENIKLLCDGKITGMQSGKNTHVHRILVTKHNYLLYQLRPRKKRIDLLVFWDTRQHPQKLNF